MDTEVATLIGIINWLDSTRSISGINSKDSLIRIAKQVVIRAMQSNPSNNNIRKAAQEIYRIEHMIYNQKDYNKKVRGRIPSTVC